MTRLYRLPAVLLVALAGLGALVPAAQAADPTEVKVALAWLRNGQYASLMVADTKGYYAEEGLKVSFIDGGPGKNPVPLVGVGQADFGVTGGTNVFLARLAPDPVNIVAIGAITQNLPYAFITLAEPGAPDPTPKDLEGKTVGMQADGEIFLKAVAARNGVDLSKVKTQVVMANAEPLLVGKVDYFTGMVHNQTYQIETETAKATDGPLKGKVWKAIRFSEYGVPFYADVIFASTEKLKTNPDLAKRFLRAVAKGLKYTVENPDDAVAILAAYPNQVEKADKLAWRLQVQNPLQVSPDTKTNGILWMDPNAWEATMAFYHQYGQIPRTLPAAEVMTNAYNGGIKSK